MTDVTAVMRELAQLTGRSAEELARYQPLAEAAADSVADEPPAHAALIAAARVNYQMALLQRAEDGVSSFKVGEVSIGEADSGAVRAAKEFLTAVEAQYSCKAAGNGFAFRSVG